MRKPNRIDLPNIEQMMTGVHCFCRKGKTVTAVYIDGSTESAVFSDAIQVFEAIREPTAPSTFQLVSRLRDSARGVYKYKTLS